MFFLIKPVGLRCQCNCGYCYYKDGHQRLRSISNKNMDISLIKKILNELHEIPQASHTFCLHGGEPLLIGKKWFQDFVTLVSKFNSEQKIQISISVQTNGLLIDRDWIDLFTLGSVEISVSLDGPRELHDFQRGVGTFDKVMSNIEMLHESNINVGALAVLTKKTTEISPLHFFEFFKTVPLNNGLDVNPYFEIGSSEIEKIAMEKHEAPAVELAHFLNELFDVWLYQENSALDIRMFEQLVGMLMEFTPSLCNLTKGKSCGRLPSVMPNGDIFACDLDIDQGDFKLGSIVEDNLKQILSTDKIGAIYGIIQDGCKRRGCYQCDMYNYCGFTCPRYTFSKKDCSSYKYMTKKIINHAKQQLNSISEKSFKKQIEFIDIVHDTAP